MFDVIIAGGGVAGLSAALILGRCRREVLVIDDDNPRNAASHALHGFLTRDGIHPLEFREIAREQIAAYPTVTFRNGEVTAACRGDDGFEVTVSNTDIMRSRTLLIATGVIDRLPPIPRLEEFYGRSVFHCPYCDGWEMRDKPIAVYGHGEAGEEFALEMKNWSEDIVLCTNGREEMEGSTYERLFRHNITLREERIVRLIGENGILEGIEFASGEVLSRRALFFLPGQRQRSALAEMFGCAIEGDQVRTQKLQETGVPGLFVAGDAARSVQLAIIAAAEGAEAAFAINTALQKETMQ